VAARLVRDPEDWPYSDFAEIVRMADGVGGGFLSRDKGVLRPSASSEEGRLLHDEGRQLPCTLREYVDMVRNDLEKGFLQSGSISEEGRLLP